jgi:glycerol-3-phosphate O-acyltransferase
MNAEVTLPLWQYWLLLGLALIVLVKQFLLPSVRWFFRKRINHAVNELNQRLNIELRPFQLTKRQVLLDRLINDPQMLRFVQEMAIEQQIPREVLMQQVNKYAREIVPSFNAYIYYRFGYWLSKKIAELLYRVRVNAEGQEHLAQMCKKSTVVFVMNHRSNMDYILVAFLMAEKMTLSYAVGEWAKVWPLQGLVRSMGAYFVRRNSKNPLYRKVLERYITMATREGVCQAVFPEGGLTRDGKIRPPKLGVFDYMLRNYQPQKDNDILFVPVGINYDRVLEDRTLLSLLEPNRKKQSRWQMLKNIAAFWLHQSRLASKKQWKKYGYASVSFAKPISVKNYCQQQQVNFSELDTEPRFEQVNLFAEHIMLHVETAVPIVPTVIMAHILLSNKASAITTDEAKKQARQLMLSIEARGGQIIFPHKDKQVSLDNCIEMMAIRHLIELTLSDNGVTEYCQVKSGAEVLLRYYENSILHWLNKPSSDRKEIEPN